LIPENGHFHWRKQAGDYHFREEKRWTSIRHAAGQMPAVSG